MFSLELPICPTSLGNVSVGILLELFRRGLTPNIFPIGPSDLSKFAAFPAGFQEWLNHCLQKSLRHFKRDEPEIKIFQIQGAAHRVSNKARLYCPHETTTLTETEINVLQQYDSVFVPSNFNREVFARHGIAAEVCPNFHEKDFIFPIKVHKDENVTYWSLIGKMEKRKNTLQIIRAWCRRFGGDRRHRLNLSVFNMFIFQGHPPEQHLALHKQFIQQNIGFALPWNVEIYGHMSYPDFNQMMNVADIDLSGLSGSEGMNLPFLNSRCLGKRGVALNAHAHLDYATNKNSVLVEPNGVEDIQDGIFFVGGDFNVGTKYTFDDEVAIAAMEEAFARPEPDSKLAEELKEKFSVENTVNKLLKW